MDTSTGRVEVGWERGLVGAQKGDPWDTFAGMGFRSVTISPRRQSTETAGWVLFIETTKHCGPQRAERM